MADNLEDELKIVNVGYAELGRYKIYLPREAVEFQQKLIKDFSAEVEPFTFDATVVEKKKVPA